jgi:hypothetical protein
MTRADILRQIAEARASLAQLAKLYPGCFDKHGKPIVASARFPLPSRAAAQGEKK